MRGGIAGSAPIWGDYSRFEYPNWAAKFFADALMMDMQDIAVPPVPDVAVGSASWLRRAIPLRVLVLCGRSPRHLYVANALCRSADVLAIVQETGSEFSWKKLARTLRPDNFFRKAWRWLRDRRRYAGNREAKFFFGSQPPAAGPSRSGQGGAAHQPPGRRPTGARAWSPTSSPCSAPR